MTPLRAAPRHATAPAAFLFVGLVWLVGPGGAAGPAPAAAQEIDEVGGMVPDSLFEAPPRGPANYQTTYSHDKSFSGWNQELDYSQSWKNLVMSASGGSSTLEDALRFGSRSTNGDLTGALNWRARPRLVLSLTGKYAMSSVADGNRESRSEQRRNGLSFQSQYIVPPILKAQLTVVGSSEFQRNYDLRTAERSLHDADAVPDSVAVERDSSFASGRLDAVRGRLTWPVASGVTFVGSAFGSRQRPITTVRKLRATEPIDRTKGVDSIEVARVQLPADNALLLGNLTIDRLPSTKFLLESSRTGIDQVYFDLGQLKVEQFSSDGRFYHARTESNPLRGLTLNADAVLRRNAREYVARPNLNALVTTRQVTVSGVYSSRSTDGYVSFDVNRTRAERQSTNNGITLTRVLTTNFRRHLVGRLSLVGIGSATLTSYRYLFTPKPSEPGRTFSKDDRDVASAFGSIGARFGVTPRCSTAANFSISRSHNVALDALQSSGNLATTVYQLNASLRMPLHRNLSIGQDYILTATERASDYNEAQDDLSRNFRIDTSVADTLFPFAVFRLDHRYYFFDQGDFSPLEPGGPRLYGPSVEQEQQTLEGTLGIRPIRGVTLEVKQGFTDFESRDLVGKTRQRTGLWNLGFGLTVSRTFWNGAGIRGSVRREESYQNISSLTGSTGKVNYWVAGATFNKEF